ncbi:FtsX-like permease family protein [Aerococcus sp. UMB1112A]|uniref:FtsX-like permease family protein n=1 Tax=Aerococcus sp. UMB1112A TaxID=3050609 RepID=UPI00254B3AD8|nr:FtsX-like permease family protein [Aerococcus sp. UMB1112A]MDK8502297.1 FtsX-like permease family protein [Aerococcus sp. UMB1112A]
MPTLWKEIWRSIRQSKARFISIFMLMLIGSFALVGLKVTGPNMRQTGRDYFAAANTADLTVIGSLGLNQEDLDQLASLDGLQEVEAGYLKDVTLKGDKESLRLFSKTENLSQAELLEGRLPETADEIALDGSYRGDYQIGDQIQIEEPENPLGQKVLKGDSYTLTGFVYSSEILSDINRGPSTAGTGALKGYGVLAEEAFDSELYMLARMTFEDLEGLDPYSQAYTDKIQAHKDQVAEVLADRPEERLAAIQDQGHKQLQAADQSIQAAQKKLDQESRRLDQAKQDLDRARLAQLPVGGDQEKALKEGEEKVKAGQAEIDQKTKEMAEAKERLDQLDLPSYMINSRREIPGGEGYRIYGTVSHIVDALANIFPIFLYFVAALLTLNTMTRFVDEERVKSGTLKALGYGRRDIVKKFVVYGFLSSFLGSVLGIGLGHILLPLIAYNAYSTGFTLPRIQLHFYWPISLLALALALLCAVLPAYIVARRALKEKPAQLLMPKAPKAGGKIFLEHFPGIWNRLGFMQKITARNIFRYKQRMLMTIFGVAGAVACLFAGLAVQESIRGINDRQFNDLIHYQMIVAEADQASDDDRQAIADLLAGGGVSSHDRIHYEQLTKTAGSAQDQQAIHLIVPENPAHFHRYVNLVNRETGQGLSLEEDGVIISERLAQLLDVGPGDVLTLEDADHKTYEMKVTGITEMYMGHFVFTNQAGYANIFGKDFQTNAQLVNLKDTSQENTENYAADFMAIDGVKGIVQNTSLQNQIRTIVNSLDKIMMVLILVAGLLAAVILYNLTTINVSERMRELSTIKVLGFYDREVTLYIYRETIILTLFGIVFGFGIGEWLHRYIIHMLPPADVMFNPALTSRPFLIPSLLVAGISLLLALVINQRLKQVDMLEALSSVE